MKLVFRISIIIIFCAFTLQAHAQIPSSIDGVDLRIDPETPVPGQSVEVSIESFSLDLSSASIVWTVNGKVQNKGVGQTKTTVTSPKVGISLTVSVNIKTAEGREIQKSVKIKSNSIDLIWEPLGYTPPFFDGKGSFAYQNTVHIIAFPHISKDGITEIDPKTLVYKWKRDGKYIDGGQGYGNQSVNVTMGDIPKPIDVSVEVYTRDQKDSAAGNIIINPSEASVSFYEDNALYGTLLNKALLGKIPLENDEMRIKAVPYGFNMSSSKSSNSYVWSINNVEQPDFNEDQSIVIRKKADQEGSSNIGLEIRNTDDILQSASGGFMIYFNKKSSTSQNATF